MVNLKLSLEELNMIKISVGDEYHDLLDNITIPIPKEYSDTLSNYVMLYNRIQSAIELEEEN